MSPPPLGISQSLKNSLISLKDENLAPCSALRSLKFSLFQPLSSELFSWLPSQFCANQALKGLPDLDVAFSMSK